MEEEIIPTEPVESNEADEVLDTANASTEAPAEEAKARVDEPADDQEAQKTNYGLIRARSIHNEMTESYLDYAMSVIVMRALPDVRDGLKPVHRRILYTMSQMNLGPSANHQKSAKI